MNHVKFNDEIQPSTSNQSDANKSGKDRGSRPRPEW